MAKDPVCGMVVKEKKGLECKCQGRTYNSCSPLCKDLFESSPESYVARIAVTGGGDKGGVDGDRRPRLLYGV